MSEKAGTGPGTTAIRAVIAALLALVAIGTLAVTADGAEAREGFPDRGFGDYGRAVAFEAAGSHGLHLAPVGDGTVVAGAAAGYVLRFGANGALDRSFGDEGKVAIPDLGDMPFEVADVDIDGEGRILVFGAVLDLDTIIRTGLMGATSPTHAAVVRLEPSGEIDHEFGEDGFFVDDFGAGGASPPYDGPITRTKHGRVRPDGSLLVLIGVGEFKSDVRNLTLSTPARVVAVLTPEGEIDRGVGREGILIDNPKVSNIAHFAVYPDGGALFRVKLKGGGRLLVRLDAEGAPDVSFGNNGFLGYARFRFDAITLGPANRIVMANDREVIRLMPDGRRDRDFGHRGRAAIRLPGKSRIAAANVGAFGRVLLSGTQAVRRRGGAPDFFRPSFTVIALDKRGRPDRGFGRGGWISSPFGPSSGAAAHAALLDGENHLVVGGFVSWPDHGRAIGLVRYDLGE